jgi:hypothetical protein
MGESSFLDVKDRITVIKAKLHQLLPQIISRPIYIILRNMQALRIGDCCEYIIAKFFGYLQGI